MAKSLVVAKLFCMAIIVWLGASNNKAQAAVTCGQVVTNLSPCVSYLRSGGNTVPGQCCNGIRTLFNMAHTTPDRQTVCTCIKNAVKGIHYSNYSLTLAAGLPKRCGVNVPYQISPSTDCTRVH